ncbi:MAG: DUF3570 domain-containing protein [Kofleriaceae bacterium]
MRLQLVTALAVACVASSASSASADGTLSMRGVYYKERATRVIQPMLDGAFDVGTKGLVTGHFLVDAITSASASSGAENATPFTENRVEGGLGYTHEVDRFRLGAEAKYSTESDYRSVFVGVRAEVDLAQKNTVLGIGGGFAADQISAASDQGGLAQPTIMCTPTESAQECSLNTMIAFASASQILSRNLVVGVTLDVSRLDGYQANPYRTAITDMGEAAERHPTLRTREAGAISVRYFVPSSQTTLIGAYRYYRDTWKVHAHTPEVRIVQQVGFSADASVRYRYHSQDGAFFYRDRYATSDITMQPYLTDDVKLDTFTGHTFEAKLGILGDSFGMEGRWAGARFEGILSYILQHPRFGNAITAQVALTVPFEY